MPVFYQKHFNVLSSMQKMGQNEAQRDGPFQKALAAVLKFKNPVILRGWFKHEEDRLRFGYLIFDLQNPRERVLLYEFELGIWLTYQGDCDLI